ncbi:Os03g0431400 [Oryza sativa Japonica Group]|uniref:Os03g0431400 protein n=1 Tax=Oryza sativa subsp. japonica TaxID=39947 RepID=A0A0N7KHH3_ORYSJ|nr:Os03g0431400 [Oryza sativa Japonica Group]
MAWDAVSGGGAPVRRGAAETAPRTAQRRTAARHGAAARGGHAAAGRAAAVLGLAAEELGQLALRWRGSAGQRYQAQAGYGDAMRRRRARAVVRCCRAKTVCSVARRKPTAGGGTAVRRLRLPLFLFRSSSFLLSPDGTGCHEYGRCGVAADGGAARQTGRRRGRWQRAAAHAAARPAAVRRRRHWCVCQYYANAFCLFLFFFFLSVLSGQCLHGKEHSASASQCNARRHEHWLRLRRRASA